MKKCLWFLIGVSFFFCLALGHHPSQAQTYPTQPIQMVIPLSPGDTVDLAGRAIAAEMSKILKASIVIVNKPGGHGGADPAIVNEFFRVIEGRARPSISPIAAREAVAAGYCATLSLRARGAPRDVPPPDRQVAARLADRARRAAAGDLRKRGIRPADQ